MTDIKAVIFDVDGVLVDSLEANSTFYRLLLEKAGYKANEADIKDCFHRTLLEAIEYLSKTTDPAEIERIWKIAVGSTIHTDHLLKFSPHLKPVLQKLHMQYRLGIATNRIKSGLDHIIKKAGVEGLFDEIVAFGDYDNPKPDPEPLLKAARLLKVSPHQAIYIGDSPTDIEAAKAAGMKSIHMSQYKHSDADAGIMSFYEVNSAVAKLDA